MGSHPIQYNRFYYNNLCHVCKEWSEKLKRCSACKMIAYCSKEHQKQDWKHHKKLCQVIATTNKDILKNISVDNFEDFVECNHYNGLFWQEKLFRTLYSFECQMWMFPRVCAVCFSKYVVIDCLECLNVAYCSESHQSLHKEQHSKHCKALKLGMTKDLYYFQDKFRPSNVNVTDFDPQIKTLPNNLEELMIMYETNNVPDKNNSEELIQFIIKSELIAPAATILYAMEKSKLLKDRMFRKSYLNVHIVGAELTEMGWLWKSITELLFHWIQNLEVLDFCLIGPELQHEGITEKFAEQLCDSCKAKHPKTRIFFKWKMYHEVVDTLVEPDIVVAFNSGLHEPDGCWYESIDCLTNSTDVPLVLTAYTQSEIEQDVNIVTSNTNRKVVTILEPQRNPFANMTPIRDWQTKDSPVFYINGYIAILKSPTEL